MEKFLFSLKKIFIDFYIEYSYRINLIFYLDNTFFC
jgi:hypothetical protein